MNISFPLSLSFCSLFCKDVFLVLTFKSTEGEVIEAVMGVEKVEIGLVGAISSKRTKSSKAFSA